MNYHFYLDHLKFSLIKNSSKLIFFLKFNIMQIYNKLWLKKYIASKSFSPGSLREILGPSLQSSSLRHQFSPPDI